MFLPSEMVNVSPDLFVSMPVLANDAIRRRMKKHIRFRHIKDKQTMKGCT